MRILGISAFYHDSAAALVEDGDTIQLGVGTLPSAILQALSGHADLGVHSGMISEAAMTLVDKGVITGARKEIDAGVIVTGTALGSQELYQRVPELPIEFRAASYTHSPRVVAGLRSFVAINAAIEVDLSGQIGAEVRRGTYVGAVGGHTDFCRAASTTAARHSLTSPTHSNGLVPEPSSASNFGASSGLSSGSPPPRRPRSDRRCARRARGRGAARARNPRPHAPPRRTPARCRCCRWWARRVPCRAPAGPAFPHPTPSRRRCCPLKQLRRCTAEQQ